MGMPGWAMVLGAPYAADKLVADPISSIYGIYKGIRDDQNNQSDDAQLKTDLARFQAGDLADINYNNYSNPVAAEKAVKALAATKDRKNLEGAAPIAKRLADFRANGQEADPYFTGAEWIKGLFTTGYGGDPMTDEEYEAMKSGAVPGLKKGSMPISSPESNPVIAKMIQDAELAAQHKGEVARTFGRKATPYDLASLALNKDTAAGFENTTQGVKRIDDMAVAEQQRAGQDMIGQVIAGNPLDGTIESWKRLEKGLYSIPNIEKKDVDTILKNLADRNSAPTGNLLRFSAQADNATANGNVALDMFGRPIEGTKITVASHPKQSGGGGGGSRDINAGKNPVLYHVQKPDGRIVQVDGTTLAGKERLAAARANGERISKVGTDVSSTSETDLRTGQTTTKKVTGGGAAPAPNSQKAGPASGVKPGAFFRESKAMPGYWQDKNRRWWGPGTKRP